MRYRKLRGIIRFFFNIYITAIFSHFRNYPTSTVADKVNSMLLCRVISKISKRLQRGSRLFPWRGSQPVSGRWRTARGTERLDEARVARCPGVGVAGSQPGSGRGRTARGTDRLNEASVARCLGVGVTGSQPGSGRWRTARGAERLGEVESAVAAYLARAGKPARRRRTTARGAERLEESVAEARCGSPGLRARYSDARSPLKLSNLRICQMNGC